MKWLHSPQYNLIYELVRQNGTWQMHLIDDKRKLQPTVPPAKFRNLHIRHESYTWPQAQQFAINCGWQVVPKRRPEMKWTYEQLGRILDFLTLPESDGQYATYYSTQDKIFEEAGWTRDEYLEHLEDLLELKEEVN